MGNKGVYSSEIINVTIEGTEEFLAALNRVEAKVVSNAAEQVLLAGARVIAADMRRRVPVGPTGNLKRSIVAKTLKSDVKPRSALAGVDRRRKGYHAHWIEYGTASRYQGTGKHPKSKVRRYTGHVPAHPFIRPAIDTNKDRVLKEITVGFEKIIDIAWR